MNLFKYSVLFVLCAFFMAAVNPGISPGKDGRTIFHENRCYHCHTVSVLNISSVRKPKPGGPPDLSNVGNIISVDSMKKFIRKEIQLNGRKHPIKFEGSDDELVVLTNWLDSLKNVKPQSPIKGK